MTKDKEKRMTPEIRFKGFSDDWEQRKWDRIVDRITTQSNDSTLPKVEFEDIVSGEGRLNKDVSSKFDDRKGIIFAPDQILFGKLRPYLQNWLLADFKGIALGDFWVFDTNKHSSLFVYYLMQSTKYQTIANLSSGTKMPRSDWKTVSQTEFSIPKDRAEEYQIGILFENLDSLITLHQQKYELLIKLKKAYLQLIFPKTGESTPKVRFADFHDNWEQRKLNEISDIYDGTHQTPKYQDEGVMFLSVENIKTLISNKFISHEAFESEFRIRPQRGDVLITRIGDVGTANVVETDENLAYYVSLALLKSEKLKPYFLQSSIQSPFVQKQIWKRTLHIAFPKKINKNEIGQVPINIPTTDEQVEIGTFFKHLDDAITLHQQKIASLKSLKQAYLQKMFV
ncbi:restriction endonuclease subunit S [Enterococcus asini]|uniref:restriction endonuclease subunit S n=1 Tax=Enterococcus asini TaxID=57732 RepID=UPI00288FDDBE|nr:restriction endonuclease subunit S [Enterococcus asini]MDT2763621.1 restriction endonuclease subunit S [Enterococcus asini]